ncbi:MAG TPA: MFS transporter [Stellaceae bacterium]|jgi:AAHS family 4-hydroxybenzoate transporter-like MFS transporter|nr:MFS transporter [Stellaceae bacterium]
MTSQPLSQRPTETGSPLLALDKPGFARLSLIVTAWASLTMFVEGFEMQLVGYAAPAMIGALHVGKAEFGMIFGASNLGFFCGALLLSALGDRFGRRRLIICGVLLFSIFTLCAAYGQTVLTLSILRLCAGIGLGGAVPNAIALTAEYAPQNRRASRITLLYVTYVLGSAGAGLLASWLIPMFGWPVVFLVGGWGGLICATLLYFFVPESLSFLAQKNGDPTVTAAVRTERPPKVPFVALFREGRIWMTLLLWTSYITAIMASQFITSWLPTLIAGTGVGISLAALTGSLYHIGGTGGNVLMGWLMDRRGLKMIAVGFAVCVPITACMGFVSATLPLLAVATFFLGLLMLGSLNGINAAAGMLYPTVMRSSGVGWTNGVGRVGSIIGPVIGGILISLKLSMSTLFLILAVPVLLTALSLAALASLRQSRNVKDPVVERLSA